MSNGYHLDKTTRKKNKTTIVFTIETKGPALNDPCAV